jgi:hypothetical protein
MMAASKPPGAGVSVGAKTEGKVELEQAGKQAAKVDYV